MWWVARSALVTALSNAHLVLAAVGTLDTGAKVLSGLLDQQLTAVALCTLVALLTGTLPGGTVICTHDASTIWFTIAQALVLVLLQNQAALSHALRTVPRLFPHTFLRHAISRAHWRRVRRVGRR